MNSEDLYSYDESHPIPDLDVIDINTVKKGGGSDLFIIVASPLQADKRSLVRLLGKVEQYLKFIQTEQFRVESGRATTRNTRIVVKIHPDSDPIAFELLDKNKQWVSNNDATLVVDTEGVAGP